MRRSGSTTEIRERERGATFVELAFALSILLAGILFFMWVGVFLQSGSALEAALSRAIRLGATRGAEELIGVNIIEDIQTYVYGGAAGKLANILATPDPGWAAAEPHYNMRARHTFAIYEDHLDGTIKNNPKLKDLPPEYTYALVYLSEALRQAIGPSVRFPCNPNDLTNGSGCVDCSFLTPNTLKDSFTGPERYEDPPGTFQPAPRREMGLECRYQPSTFILTPLVRLIGLISGGSQVPLIVVSRRQYLDIPSF